jgi:ABC-type transporter Mla maintaining outer membrane lipid asymmetry ATPase subunit MlaF
MSMEGNESGRQAVGRQPARAMSMDGKSENSPVLPPPPSSAGARQFGRDFPSVPVIEMRGVAVGSLRDFSIVAAENVNWRVQPGEFWVVGGLHGAGKSDLLMLAGGIMAPLRGSYEFLGESMPIFSEEHLSHRLKIGLVFEGGRLFNQLTVAENIALPLRYHRNFSTTEVEPLVRELLEVTGLSHCAGSRPGTLGRNWQRRVALARALALRPEVLLLDTPLAALDQRQQKWWFEILDGLAHGHPLYGGRSVTLVVTSANLRDWRGHAGRFALLDDRRFIVVGGWEDVERSSDPLVRDLALGAR